MATSLGFRHDREARMEHCPPTSVNPPDDPRDRLVGRGARGAAAAVSVQPELAPCFSSAVWSVRPPVPEACTSQWLFTRPGWLQVSPCRNQEWIPGVGWGKGLLKQQATSNWPGEQFRGSTGNEVWHLRVLRVSNRQVNLAGAGSSVRFVRN